MRGIKALEALYKFVVPGSVSWNQYKKRLEGTLKKDT